MRRKLIIDGNAVYEIDDECAQRKAAQERMQATQSQLRRDRLRENREGKKDENDTSQGAGSE